MSSLAKVNSSKVAELAVQSQQSTSIKQSQSSSVSKIEVITAPKKQGWCDWFLEKIQNVWQAILYVLCCKCCWKEDKKQSAIEDKTSPKKEILPLDVSKEKKPVKKETLLLNNSKETSQKNLVSTETVPGKKEILPQKNAGIAKTASTSSKVASQSLPQISSKAARDSTAPLFSSNFDQQSFSLPRSNLSMPSLSSMDLATPARPASLPQQDLPKPSDSLPGLSLPSLNPWDEQLEKLKKAMDQAPVKKTESANPDFSNMGLSLSPKVESKRAQIDEAAAKDRQAMLKGVKVGTARFGKITAEIFKGMMPDGTEAYRFFDGTYMFGYVSFNYYNEGFKWRSGDEPFDKISHISIVELFNHEKGKVKLLGKAALEIIFRESIARGCKGVVKVDAAWGSKYFYFTKGHYITHPDKNFERAASIEFGKIYRKLSQGSTPLDDREQQMYEGRKADLIKNGIAVEKLTPKTICMVDETQLIKDQLADANGQRIPASDALWMCLTNDDGGIDWWWNEVETNPLVDIPSLQIKR